MLLKHIDLLYKRVFTPIDSQIAGDGGDPQQVTYTGRLVDCLILAELVEIRKLLTLLAQKECKECSE